MRILLDTHTFLWYALDHPQLSKLARDHIRDASNEKLVSPATYWEIAIKLSIGNWRSPARTRTSSTRGSTAAAFRSCPCW